MKIFSKKVLIPTIIILVLIIFGASCAMRGDNTELDTIVAERADLLQEVSVTGRVQPAQNVDLAFERSGKVYATYVDVGDNVTAGQLLAVLNSGGLSADVQQAEARVESARALLEQYQSAVAVQQAKLDEIKNGARPEEITIAETNVSNALATLANTKEKAAIDLKNLNNTAFDVISNGYATGDAALNNQTTDLFTSSEFPELSFITTDSQAGSNTKAAKLDAQRMLADLRVQMNGFAAEMAEQILLDAETSLRSTRTFLNYLSDAANNAVGIDESTISLHKSSINTARTSVNAAITSIVNQKQLVASQKITSKTAIDSAENALKIAREQLQLKKAGATQEQISAQEAALNQAKANLASQEAQIKQSVASVSSSRAQLAKNALRSPMGGIITNQDVKVGEIVMGQTPVISVMSSSEFEIKTRIPEVDIADVSVSDTAEITLDAYDDDVVFEATVVAIDPAETIVEGVSTYEVTLQFMQKDERIKSGMTANVDILTDKKENVIAIPGRAVITKDGDKIVRVLNGEDIIETQVQTGIRGLNGKVEIIEGIQEGDTVITFLDE